MGLSLHPAPVRAAREHAILRDRVHHLPIQVRNRPYESSGRRGDEGGRREMEDEVRA